MTRTLFDLPLWDRVRPYRRVTTFGKVVRLEFLQVPDTLRAEALAAVAHCPACGREVHPLRARMKSKRARTAGSEAERRLFYAPTCPSSSGSGCSRTQAAREHHDRVRRLFGAESTAPVACRIEVRDAAGTVLSALEYRSDRAEIVLPAGARSVVAFPVRREGP